MTNASGTEVETAEYMPFGSERDHTGSVTTDYKFTDQELDRSTGLYNYDARLYDPVIGRFISPDTIVPGPTDPQMLNRYSYVRNNPLIYTDPTGHALDFGILYPGSSVSRSSTYSPTSGLRYPSRSSRLSYPSRDSTRSTIQVSTYPNRLPYGCATAAVAMVMDYYSNMGREHLMEGDIGTDLQNIARSLGAFEGRTEPYEMAPGIEDYVRSRGYVATVTRMARPGIEASDTTLMLTWEALTGEIDAGRPVLLEVYNRWECIYLRRYGVQESETHTVVMVDYYQTWSGGQYYVYNDPNDWGRNRRRVGAFRLYDRSDLFIWSGNTRSIVMAWSIVFEDE